MKHLLLSFQTLTFLVGGQIVAGQAPEVLGAELKPETLAAYSRYVGATEARITHELGNPDAFLHIDTLPEPRRAEVLSRLGRGEIFITPLETRDAAGREIRAPGGLIHHWFGALFIRGTNLRQVRDFVQDYDHHQEFYKPQIVRSRLIRRDGNDFRIFFRLRKHKLITVTLDTEHAVRYTPVDATRLYSYSHSIRIAEVENADRPTEHEKPVGHDNGFLWRIDSWWRFEQRDGGVYIECDSVSLTRDIPTGLGWLIRPFITDIPKESLQMTLGSTRSAVLERASAARKS